MAKKLAEFFKKEKSEKHYLEMLQNKKYLLVADIRLSVRVVSSLVDVFNCSQLVCIYFSFIC